jgi:NAD(P)-dependent dehydrogenase (short-subunit alcohol dehydrogenase family)
VLSTARVAVVTGGSSGIGEAIARRLTGRGWRCVLVARGEDRLRALAGELGAEWHACDVSDREAVERAAEAVRAQVGAVNLLVNNAGVPARRDFLSAEPEVVESVLRINYLGTLWPTRAFLPALRDGMPDARVVNVVSVAGHVAFVPAGPYTASKHAQLALSRSLAAQLGREGIRVHTVCPGFVATEGFPQRDLVRHPVLKRIVVGPERVADHVLDVIESGRAETFVPGYYRLAALAQALAPRLVGRISARAPGG